jgi:hypothetical protein
MTCSCQLTLLPVEVAERLPATSRIMAPRNPSQRAWPYRVYRMSQEPPRAFTYGANGRIVGDWPAGERIDLYI